MEHVEIAHARREPPRVIPEPSGQAISELHARTPSNQRQPAPPLVHPRTQLHRLDPPSRYARQRLHQHVADEIHAGPPLFEIVTDDANAKGCHELTRHSNHTCVASRGPSHENGLATTRSSTNCRRRRSRRT